ncbi:hypothetical protein [Aneurinibacillus aneurinilyticus]|uniref:hypothetical protein n=1 Tax=Aneurinibacillus aneurinilyticus TaxID=1391 RepID=UPI002E1FEBA2|nr:hypothetical protein [Aneurinibacillus aneurinilyticus]
MPLCSSAVKNKGDARRTRHSFLSIYGYQGCSSVQETNRRPFRARCGDDPLWIILDNQYP